MSSKLPESWVRDIVEDVMGNNLEIGKQFTHPDGRLVQITDGQFWGTYGLSNWWKWREVLPGGTLSETEESGYGWK